jgi:hypothetical protein
VNHIVVSQRAGLLQQQGNQNSKKTHGAMIVGTASPAVHDCHQALSMR